MIASVARSHLAGFCSIHVLNTFTKVKVIVCMYDLNFPNALVCVCCTFPKHESKPAKPGGQHVTLPLPITTTTQTEWICIVLGLAGWARWADGGDDDEQWWCDGNGGGFFI